MTARMPYHTFQRVVLGIALIVVLTVLLAAPRRAGAETVTLFAAASLKPALDAIADTPGLLPEGVELSLSYGGSSTLARQIQYGAPAQIFLSANSAWMDALEGKGLLTPGSRVDLLANELVLIGAPGAALANINALPGHLGPHDQVAMALVNAVPAGIYGREAFETLGVWETLRPRVVQSDNVRSALRLVAAGEAAFGVVYATDPGADPQVEILATFPAASHSPIRYPMALIGEAKEVARQVHSQLQSEAAQAIFAAYGFEPLAADQ